MDFPFPMMLLRPSGGAFLYGSLLLSAGRKTHSRSQEGRHTRKNRHAPGISIFPETLPAAGRIPCPADRKRPGHRHASPWTATVLSFPLGIPGTQTNAVRLPQPDAHPIPLDAEFECPVDRGRGLASGETNPGASGGKAGRTAVCGLWTPW